MNACIDSNIKLTKLYTHNKNVDLENSTELSKLNSLEKYFFMEI